MTRPLMLTQFFLSTGPVGNRSIGASILIDDNPSYAVECAEAGINVLLYDWNHSYPWSKLDEA